jgi:large conductance mechanosensitive channel
MLKGFKAFIFRGNVVDLAVAVVIGTVFAAVVKAFVADIVTPLIAAAVGKPNFGALTFTVHRSHFLYGVLVNSVVSFLAVALVVYAVVVAPLNLLAARRASGAAPEPEPSPEAVLLTEIRDLLARSGEGTMPA